MLERMYSVGGSTQTDLGSTEATQLLRLAAKLEPQHIEFVSFPEALFKSDRVQDPVLGNTSILAADFKVLKTYVEKFNKGAWFEPEVNRPDPITPEMI